MSWFVWLFGFFVVLGASQLARWKGADDGKVSAILLAGLIASIGYFFVGRAELPDQPFSKRAAELDSRDPVTWTPGERLARLQGLIKTQPDAPQPHAFIGDMMRAQGRDADAVRAYQSALRRDDRFVPAIVGLGDALTRLARGEISPDIKNLYARAYVLDETQIRAGFITGLADWQAGDRAAARARWASMQQRLSPEDPLARELASYVLQVEDQQTVEPSPE